jgi:hypothetical protein
MLSQIQAKQVILDDDQTDSWLPGIPGLRDIKSQRAVV